MAKPPEMFPKPSHHRERAPPNFGLLFHLANEDKAAGRFSKSLTPAGSLGMVKDLSLWWECARRKPISSTVPPFGPALCDVCILLAADSAYDRSYTSAKRKRQNVMLIRRWFGFLHCGSTKVNFNVAVENVAASDPWRSEGSAFRTNPVKSSCPDRKCLRLRRFLFFTNG